MTSIDFYFDFWSPYAYLASHRLAEIADTHGCEINYLPIDLKRAKVAAGNSGPANIEIKPKIRYLMQDLKRWADRYGLPFGQIPKGHRIDRINKGTFFAIDHGSARDYVREAYRLVWGEGGAPDSEELLTDLARKMGWNPEDFLSYIGSGVADERYEQTFEKAVSRGVFGVPIILIGDQMWWGNDRLQFVEEYLTGKA